MKSLKNYIYESVEEFRVSDLEVNYTVRPEEIILQAPEVFQESDIQQYMDDMWINSLPSGQDNSEKFFGKNYSNIIDAHFEYDSISQAMGKDQKVDLVWDEKYDRDIKDSSELITVQISNLKYTIEFEKFLFDHTINDTNVRKTLETLLQTTVSNSINKYPIEISLNNSNITFDGDEN